MARERDERAFGCAMHISKLTFGAWSKIPLHSVIHHANHDKNESFGLHATLSSVTTFFSLSPTPAEVKRNSRVSKTPIAARPLGAIVLRRRLQLWPNKLELEFEPHTSSSCMIYNLLSFSARNVWLRWVRKFSSRNCFFFHHFDSFEFAFFFRWFMAETLVDSEVFTRVLALALNTFNYYSSSTPVRPIHRLDNQHLSSELPRWIRLHHHLAP